MYRLERLVAASACISLALALASCAQQPRPNLLNNADAGLDLTLPQYLARGGEDLKVVDSGKLKIDGHTMRCGNKPTVIDNTFDSWAGAYPDFVILNLERMKGLPTPVRLFIYAHECSHTQPAVGRDESAADCAGVKRGRRYGWLKEEGLAQVCDFISRLKGDADHADGPKRCEIMRKCYIDAAPRSSRN